MGILDRVGTGEYQVPDQIDPARTDLRDEFMASAAARICLSAAWTSIRRLFFDFPDFFVISASMECGDTSN